MQDRTSWKDGVLLQYVLLGGKIAFGIHDRMTVGYNE